MTDKEFAKASVEQLGKIHEELKHLLTQREALVYLIKEYGEDIPREYLDGFKGNSNLKQIESTTNSQKCGCGRPIKHKGRCSYRRQKKFNPNSDLTPTRCDRCGVPYSGSSYSWQKINGTYYHTCKDLPAKINKDDLGVGVFK